MLLLRPLKLNTPMPETIIKKLGRINHILAMYPLGNTPGIISKKYFEVITMQKEIIKDLLESTNK